MHKLYLIISLLITCTFLTACKDSNFTLRSKTNLLLGTWIMESYVDHETNTSFEVSDNRHQFLSNGTYVVYVADTVPEVSTWELVDKDEYLRMGANVYKLKILTAKLLGLQYGTIDIFYIPAD